jgi:hypothetical protein
LNFGGIGLFVLWRHERSKKGRKGPEDTQESLTRPRLSLFDCVSVLV